MAQNGYGQNLPSLARKRLFQSIFEKPVLATKFLILLIFQKIQKQPKVWHAQVDTLVSSNKVMNFGLLSLSPSEIAGGAWCYGQNLPSLPRNRLSNYIYVMYRCVKPYIVAFLSALLIPLKSPCYLHAIGAWSSQPSFVSKRSDL